MRRSSTDISTASRPGITELGEFTPTWLATSRPRGLAAPLAILAPCTVKAKFVPVKVVLPIRGFTQATTAACQVRCDETSLPSSTLSFAIAASGDDAYSINKYDGTSYVCIGSELAPLASSHTLPGVQKVALFNNVLDCGSQTIHQPFAMDTSGKLWMYQFQTNTNGAVSRLLAVSPQLPDRLLDKRGSRNGERYNREITTSLAVTTRFTSGRRPIRRLETRAAGVAPFRTPQ